jgi:hypothetical protein
VREGWVAGLIPLELSAIAGVDVAGTVRATGEGVTDFRIWQTETTQLNRNSVTRIETCKRITCIEAC